MTALAERKAFQHDSLEIGLTRQREQQREVEVQATPESEREGSSGSRKRKFLLVGTASQPFGQWLRVVANAAGKRIVVRRPLTRALLQAKSGKSAISRSHRVLPGSWAR